MDGLAFYRPYQQWHRQQHSPLSSSTSNDNTTPPRHYRPVPPPLTYQCSTVSGVADLSESRLTGERSASPDRPYIVPPTTLMYTYSALCCFNQYFFHPRRCPTVNRRPIIGAQSLLRKTVMYTDGLLTREDSQAIPS